MDLVRLNDTNRELGEGDNQTTTVAEDDVKTEREALAWNERIDGNDKRKIGRDGRLK